MSRIHTLPIMLLLAFLGLSGWAPPSQGSAPGAIAGDWQGTLAQSPGGTHRTFLFRVSLSQSGEQIQGVSRIEVLGQPQYYAVMSLSGSVSQGGITITEQTITEQAVEPNTFWCLKSARLRYTATTAGETLTGDWTSPGCAPGNIVLTRPAGASAAPAQSSQQAVNPAQSSPPASAPPPAAAPVQSAPPASQASGAIAEFVRVDPSRATLGQPVVVDFQVNGMSFPACDQTFRSPVRVLLVFDRSGSMDLSNLMDSGRAAANSFIDLLEANQDEIGLLSFASDLRLDQPPTKNYASVRDKIALISAGGGTNTAGAINEARRILGGSQLTGAVQPVILLLTDGRPDDTSSAITAAQAARDAGIIVLAINAGDLKGEPILQQMVQDPATDYFFAPTAADLQATFAQAFKTFERLALVGSDVTISEHFADGYVPLPESIVPEDGKIVGNTIEWRLERLARRDALTFSYHVRPVTLEGKAFSTGQQVTYTDCNSTAQSLIAPVSSRGTVSITDPATLSFTSQPRNQPFLSSDVRPRSWLWLGLGLLIVLLLGGLLWLLSRRRSVARH